MRDGTIQITEPIFDERAYTNFLKEKKELAKIDMGAGVTATFVPAHGTLFVNTMSQLYALASGATSSVAR